MSEHRAERVGVTRVPGPSDHACVPAYGCYPVLVALAWRYVRLAERNERALVRVVERFLVNQAFGATKRPRSCG